MIFVSSVSTMRRMLLTDKPAISNLSGAPRLLPVSWAGVDERTDLFDEIDVDRADRREWAEKWDDFHLISI
jgi:hypothetical protein